MCSAKKAAVSEIAELVAELRLLTPAMLRTRLEDLTREPCRSGNKEWLIQRIAWVTQARVEGGLPERARARALSIARDEDLRYRPTPAFVDAVERRGDPDARPTAADAGGGDRAGGPSTGRWAGTLGLCDSGVDGGGWLAGGLLSQDAGGVGALRRRGVSSTGPSLITR